MEPVSKKKHHRRLRRPVLLLILAAVLALAVGGTLLMRREQPEEIISTASHGELMDKASVEEIAKLPGLEGMLSMFAGALTSTLSGLAVAMQAYVDKSSEEPAA